jgi:flagellar basal-body rod protein FlgC
MSMDITKSMTTAASGMRVQSDRMRIIAENIANASSTAVGANGEPYRRQVVTFKEAMDDATGATIVRVDRTMRDKSDFKMQYNPGHPAADEKGYVMLPNVNTLIEMTDMREAQRAYEANLNVVDAARNMMSRTLDLLRR